MPVLHPISFGIQTAEVLANWLTMTRNCVFFSFAFKKAKTHFSQLNSTESLAANRS
jgi:hypothetical protein